MRDESVSVIVRTNCNGPAASIEFRIGTACREIPAPGMRSRESELPALATCVEHRSRTLLPRFDVRERGGRTHIKWIAFNRLVPESPFDERGPLRAGLIQCALIRGRRFRGLVAVNHHGLTGGDIRASDDRPIQEPHLDINALVFRQSEMQHGVVLAEVAVVAACLSHADPGIGFFSRRSDSHLRTERSRLTIL